MAFYVPMAVAIRVTRRVMRQASFLTFSIRLFAVIAYLAIAAAASVHAASHDEGTLYDNVCALCKFADLAPSLGPEAVSVVVPENALTIWIPAFQHLSTRYSDSNRAIRAPPCCVFSL